MSDTEWALVFLDATLLHVEKGESFHLQEGESRRLGFIVSGKGVVRKSTNPSPTITVKVWSWSCLDSL